MKDFLTLTAVGQFRRLRRMAEAALPAYGLQGATLTPLVHLENTTFRVDIPAHKAPQAPPSSAWQAGRYLLRIHSPIYHTPAEIASELVWLDHLHQSGIVAPVGVIAEDGKQWRWVEVPGIPQPRVCTLMYWVKGRFVRKRRPLHFQRVGERLGQMQHIAKHFTPPEDFTRQRADGEGLFADSQGRSESPHIWKQCTPAQQQGMRHAIAQIQQWMKHWGDGPEHFGLIHRDLHAKNVIFAGQHAHPIDFDDTSFGYWMHDLAIVLFHEASGNSANRDALLRGYQTHMPLPSNTLERIQVMQVATCLMIYLWILERSLDNNDIAALRPAWSQRCQHIIQTLPPPSH